MTHEAVPAPVVRLRGVRRSFREGGRTHDVLRGVELEVAAGEIVAVLGPSGSGKSTLLNVIGGIDDPDAGTIEIAGVRVDGMPERQRTLLRRSRLGFVFQFFNLVPTLTVGENVVLPLELNGWDAAAAGARARALLGRVGLESRAGSYPDVLSGGEQQRVAIVRALAHEPPLLLADEPTGNLDRETGLRVLALLDELVRGAGASMVVVTHSADVLSLADRVLTLDEGLLVPTGGPVAGRGPVP